MKRRIRLGSLLAAMCLVLQPATEGHGGTYRGPGDTVPPGGSSGGGGVGPTTGGSGPSNPGPPPVTPGNSPGVPLPFGTPTGQTGTITGGGAITTTDLTMWQFWWGFNKEPYLNLRQAVRSHTVVTGDDEWFAGRGQRVQAARDTLRPTEETIRNVVVPALLEALESERQNDIVTGCLIALAKIGDAEDEQGNSAFHEVIRSFLKDPVQEISETAAVALGILANDASIPLLTELMQDTPVGRQAVGSTSVNYRTRAFAADGLGLIGHATESNDTRREIVASLIEVLELPRQPTRDLKVAALTSLGLVPVDIGLSPVVPAGEEVVYDARHHASTRDTQVDYVLELFRDKRGQHDLIRAHAPRVLCQLAPEDGTQTRVKIATALVEAAAPRSPERAEVIQSAVLALGQLGDCDADAHDQAMRKTLTERIRASGEPQAKRFAVIALAQIGGRPGESQPDKGYDKIKKDLTTYLARTGMGMSQLKPWIGLGLGIMQKARVEAGQLPDPDVALALRTALMDCKRPMDVGAYCLGVGIAKDQEARDAVLEIINRFSDDEARGYAAVALGLMDANEATEPIQEIIRESKYRPELLRQAAIGLGLLGDKTLVDTLVGMLQEARGLATQAALSSALGFIGDTHSVEPLVAMLKDDSITASARGFAAVSLGIVASKEDLPWNTKLSRDINYRANTTTLTGDNGTGILDIK